MTENNIGSNWRLIGPTNEEPTDAAMLFWKEGVKAAPSEYVVEELTKILPREKTTGECKLCGHNAELTREHIPPKESGNKHRTVDEDVMQWIERQDLEPDLKNGKKYQGGIYGYTLCWQCNSVTGALYGSEYQKWAAGGYNAFSKLPEVPEELNKQLGAAGQWPWSIKVRAGSKENPVHPGALVRQVLSMFCSLSGAWDLAERYPRDQTNHPGAGGGASP